MDPLDAFLRAALEQAGMAPGDDEDWAQFRLVYDTMTPALDELASANLGAAPPEPDLDPARPPRWPPDPR